VKIVVLLFDPEDAMNRKIFAVICLLVLLGCGDSGTKSGEDEYIVSFKLIDAAGNTTTSYKLGDDINFVFSIVNNTGEKQTWTSAYNWPSARFVILQGDNYLGSTYETMPAKLTLHGTLNQGEMLQTTASWFDHSWHAPLPLGAYTARAYLNYELSDLQEPIQSWTVDFTVEPPVQGTREVLAWCRFGEMGFCPPVNRIYYAIVLHNADSSYTMTGTTLFDNSLLTMPCFNAGWTDNCFIQIPFGTIYLYPQQAAALEQLLAGFPVEDHILNPACDPCLINRYYFNDRVEEINPCASGSDFYWHTVADIDTLLHDILSENINPALVGH
jgi:hypothetical protein